MSAVRDYSCVRLERHNWLSANGELMSRLRAITDQRTAPVVITVSRAGHVTPQFVSEGNCVTVVSSIPATEFDQLDILVSPRGGESAVPWPISEPHR
jgi:hypothetical protein